MVELIVMHQRTFKLTIAYDGTEYHGWQIQPGLKTVQSTLCDAVSKVCQTSTHVQGSGRTDAGVHAQGQVGVFKTCHHQAMETLPLAINQHLPRDIVVRQAEEVAPDFDVIRHVTQKHYQYTLHLSSVPDVRTARFSWLYPGQLECHAMRQAAQYLVGEHDFRSFACTVEPDQNTVRTIHACDIHLSEQNTDTLVIDVKGHGFMHHMVRIMVGTLVDIGKGHWPASHMPNILAARNRKAAGYLAPPEGLCLMAVEY
ncbi:MAG: tRNA pseudouridine(38-40) synthase TruA [Phycisphaeraceae bacterium]|nr:tRNA pseudouridine(38-40) synthase TruA [Phycisphaeraceae bacterium]